MTETGQGGGQRDCATARRESIRGRLRRLTMMFPRPQQQEEIPRLLGLCLVGVYLAGMFLIGAASWRFHRQAMAADAANWARIQATQFARSIAPLVGEHHAEIRLRVAELCLEPRIVSCQVAAPGGEIVAANKASLIGKQLMDVARSETASSSAGSAADGRSTLTVHVPIPGAGGEVSGGVLLGVDISESGAEFGQLWTACSLALLAILLALLTVYRAIRRALRPAAAIRDNLLTVGDELEVRLGELRVARELGEVGAAWNQVIDLVTSLREELAGVKSTQELARALEEMDRVRSREILESLPDGLLLVDDGGQVVLMNHVARRLLGVPEEAGSQELAAVSSDAELNELLVRMTGADGRNHRANVYHTLRHGEHETTLLVTVLKVELSGELQGTLVLLRDVSQQKHAERARDDFLQQVTHELRTPLSNIRAYTETLMEGILDDKEAYKECLNVINTEARRLGRLVEDVLQASQLEVGAVRLKVSEVDLTRLLQKAVQDLQATADEKQIELRLQLPPKVPSLRGDKERLAVVFSNLIGNALKYTEAGGHVTVDCRCEGNLIDVAVRDTGMGIASEEIPFVFDKFYRSKLPEVQQRPGTGLGLATARQIVRLHGGDITVTSELNKGSCFAVTLPVGEGVEAAAGRPVNVPEDLARVRTADGAK